MEAGHFMRRWADVTVPGKSMGCAVLTYKKIRILWSTQIASTWTREYAASAVRDLIQISIQFGDRFINESFINRLTDKIPDPATRVRSSRLLHAHNHTLKASEVLSACARESGLTHPFGAFRGRVVGTVGRFDQHIQAH